MAEGEREPFADIAFTRSVKAMQSSLDSRARMESLERAGRRQAEMNDTILAFVAALANGMTVNRIKAQIFAQSTGRIICDTESAGARGQRPTWLGAAQAVSRRRTKSAIQAVTAAE